MLLLIAASFAIVAAGGAGASDPAGRPGAPQQTGGLTPRPADRLLVLVRGKLLKRGRETPHPLVEIVVRDRDRPGVEASRVVDVVADPALLGERVDGLTWGELLATGDPEELVGVRGTLRGGSPRPLLEVQIWYPSPTQTLWAHVYELEGWVVTEADTGRVSSVLSSYSSHPLEFALSLPDEFVGGRRITIRHALVVPGPPGGPLFAS